MIIDSNQIKALTKEDSLLLLQTGIVLLDQLIGGDNTALESIELIIQRLDDLESHTYATKLQETLDFYGSIENDTNVIDIFLIVNPKDKMEGE